MVPRADARESLRNTIGKLLCVGIPGPRLDAAARDSLATLRVGTVVLFRRNEGSLGELKDLCAALHGLPSRPFIAIDHEGGRVHRLASPFTHFPPAAAIGRHADPESAYQVGLAMGKELRSVGIDINFAPVLDVHSNPANPVIGDRSFGSDPTLVADLAMAQMRGLLAGGVIPCGKHFPGHGDTAKDSHHELPVVERTRQQLEQIELIPFRAAIAANIPMLMTAHVVYPSLDPQRPATLSRTIVTDFLRGELGFRGVIASDDLDMRAIADHQSIGAAVVEIVRAGVDMLLLCNDLAKAHRAFEALVQAANDGVLSPAHLQASAQRIASLRSQMATASPCHLPDPAHQALAAALA